MNGRHLLVSGFFFAVSAMACGGATTDASATDGQGTASEDALVTAKSAAGAYQNVDVNHAAGEIYQLLLRPDKSFRLWLKGQYGCDVYAGYTCPASYSDGRTDETYVAGSWSVTSKGVTLQPEGQGRDSDPISLTLSLSSGKAKVEGTIVPNRRIFGTLDVAASFAKAHSVDGSDLDGTWKVTGDNNGDSQPTLIGTNMFVGSQYTHTLTFDASSGAFRDRRSDSRTRKDDGTFLLGGISGNAKGVLILDNGFSFNAVPVVSLSGSQVTFDVNPSGDHRHLVAEKQ